MNLSDEASSSDDTAEESTSARPHFKSSLEDDSRRPPKRKWSTSFGTSPTTSHDSVLQESDEEPTDTNNVNSYRPPHQKRAHNYHYPKNDVRLSRSSMSENCSSPTDEDCRPSFDDHDADEGPTQPSFNDTNDNTFYTKPEESDIGVYSEKATQIMTNMGFTSNNKEIPISHGLGGYSEKTKQTMTNMGFTSNNKEIDDSLSTGYSEKSKRMMSNMGFKPGKGLGKYEHGRTEPIEASSQKGRRGLGLRPSTVGEVPADFKWTPDELKPEAKEKVLWMPIATAEPVSGDLLDEWLQRGPKKLTIDDETEFVDPYVLKGVLDAKTIFDSLDDEDLRRARFRSNPYETIGAVIFLNRAAVKMANIDAVFDFMFTSPKKQNGESAIDKKEILYFADVCAGPGGFSEYVLYKKGWQSKGFGFTLKGPCDFKLSDFYAGTPETFNPYYGVKDDGNIFNPENLSALKKNVLKHTDDKGVHFLMADGGFSVEGQENIQEILSKQLYLCQCLAALMLVRTGGHFVVKLFDVFTLFSVGLIYIMYRCFDKVSIHKPVTSRPANSERYLVCMWKKLGSDAAEQHLFNVNSLLWNGLQDGEDVTELVSLSAIHEDTEFFEYIYKSNCILGELQIKNLLKIAAFSKDKTLREPSQAQIREQCLKLWHLPDKVRTQPERLNPDDTLLNILSNMKTPPPDSSNVHTFKGNVLNSPPQYLEQAAVLDTFKNVYDWHFMYMGSNKSCKDLRFFLSCGGKHVHQLEGKSWRNVVDLHITMPAKTLIYAEVVKEYRGQNQIYSKALHVVDAVMLGGFDVSYMPLTKRIKQCELFCAALEKPFDGQAMPIRCKRLFNLEHLSQDMNNLEVRATKRLRRAVTADAPTNNRDMFYVVESVLFIKEIKVPWVAQISKSSGYKYYFCIENKRSEYHIPESACLDTISTFTGRVLWPWGLAASDIVEGKPTGDVSRHDVEEHIQRNIKR